MLSWLTSLAACTGQQVVNALVPTGGYTQHSSIAYGDESRQVLDVYVPKDVAPNAPVIVFFYGGRWQDGDRAGYKFVAQALASKGYLVVIPDYRLYPQIRFPAFVYDAAHAVQWTYANIERFGGNPAKLFLMGHSAGAHIAALLGLDEKYLKSVGGSTRQVAGIVGIAGPYDFLPLTDDDLKEIFGPPDDYPASQPINFVDGRNPPMLLLHGLDDKTVKPKNTRHLAAKIEKKGGDVEAVYYPDKAHIDILAALAAPLRFIGTTLSDVTAFIEKHSQIESTTLAAKTSS